jgi:hypothetical protein
MLILRIKLAASLFILAILNPLEMSKLLTEYLKKKKGMNKAEFKSKIASLLQGGDIEREHSMADDLMVEVLESHGYDLSDFKEATLWYA